MYLFIYLPPYTRCLSLWTYTSYFCLIVHTNLISNLQTITIISIIKRINVTLYKWLTLSHVHTKLSFNHYPYSNTFYSNFSTASSSRNHRFASSHKSSFVEERCPLASSWNSAKWKKMAIQLVPRVYHLQRSGTRVLQLLCHELSQTRRTPVSSNSSSSR